MLGPGGEPGCRCCCTLLFLAYAWSAAPADDGIAPIPGPRLFQPALGKVRRRSPDTCKPGNHLYPSLQNQSMGEFTDFPQSCCACTPCSWAFQAATVPHAPIREGQQQQKMGAGASNLEGSQQAVIVITARPVLLPKAGFSAQNQDLKQQCLGLRSGQSLPITSLTKHQLCC